MKSEASNLLFLTPDAILYVVFQRIHCGPFYELFERSGFDDIYGACTAEHLTDEAFESVHIKLELFSGLPLFRGLSPREP